MGSESTPAPAAGLTPAAIAFAGGALDRADHLRDGAHAQRLRSLPGSRVVLVGAGQAIAVTDERGLALTAVAALPLGARLTLLGLDSSGSAVFAYDVLDDPRQGAGERATPGAGQFLLLRELMSELAPAEAALGAYSVGMVGWHRVNRHCGRCGRLTAIEHAGHRRRCPTCGLVHFPRTDPAVTMLVQTSERCLLSRRHGAPEHRWSALAGFVEPGETPEQAVAREAREETGVEIIAVEYVTAQPWPFPSALMLGFWAYARPDAGDALTPQAGELLDARWFERAELTAGIEAGAIVLPPPGTIGNYLISTWLARARE